MEELQEKIKRIVLEKVDCEAIILFGSYARNTQNAESDIDIAIKTKEVITKKDIFYIVQELEEEFKKDIDLIDINSIGDGFRYEILMNGIILYCEDKLKFELYKLDMCKEYLELNESRKLITENIKNGGTIYGK